MASCQNTLRLVNSRGVARQFLAAVSINRASGGVSTNGICSKQYRVRCARGHSGRLSCIASDEVVKDDLGFAG